MSEHLARVGDELLENGELRWRQTHFGPSKSHNMPREVNFKGAKLLYATRGRHPLPLGTAQYSAHTGQEFFHPKRLGQIVVRAQIERRDLVAFSIQRGQHDDGNGGMLTHAPADLKSIHAWHHDVQYQQMGVFPFPQRQGFQAVACLKHLEAARSQIAAHEVTQRRFIFSQQNALCPRRHGWLPSTVESSVASISTRGVVTAGNTSGSENVMVVPCTLLSAQIALSWASTKALQIVSPRPVPPECCWRPYRAR